MGSTTSRLDIPYPVSSDPNNIPSDMEALANRLDLLVAPLTYGTFATIPAPGNQGFEYFATDTLILYLDTGTQWIALNESSTVGGSPTTSNPGDVGAAGVSAVGAAVDHKHARESYPGSGGLFGTTDTVSRGDHAHLKIYTIDKTWAVSGQIQTPSGSNGYLPPAIVSSGISGESVTLEGVRAICRSGTVTYKIQRNGADVTGLTGLTATTSISTLSQPSSTVTFNDGDLVVPVVTAVSGSPDGLAIAVMVSYSETS